MSAYSGEKWRSARAEAMRRDNGRCQSCGTTQDLHAHHIKPVREFDTEQEAHYPDNLVMLCKYCHKEWEGRRERPSLIGPDAAISTNAVVNELTFDTLKRHALSGAMQTILWRWLAFNPARCSNCLVSLGRRPKDGYLERFDETLTAVVYSKSDLPSPHPNLYKRPPVENYCDDCPSEPVSYGSSTNSDIKKANNAASSVGFPKKNQKTIDRLMRFHARDLHNVNIGGDARLASFLCKIHGLPEPARVSLMADYAVPEREIRVSNQDQSADVYREVDQPTEYLP